MSVTQKKPRVGIAGAGLMGRWHANYLRRADADLVAIYDRDPSRSEKLVSEAQSSTSIAESAADLLSGFGLDSLHICTPLDSHFELASKALEAGVHVVVEKPLASDTRQTRELLKIAGEHQRILCPVHQMGFQHGVQDTLKQLATLGEILQMRFVTCSAGGEGSSAGALNDIVADILPHPLSLVQTLKPEIDIEAIDWKGTSARAGDLSILGTQSGVMTDISISMTSRPTRCEMSLYCSKGRAFLNFFHGYSVIETGKASRAQKAIQPFKYSIREFLLAGANAIRRLAGRELAYPGLNDFLGAYYRAVINGDEPPVSPDQVLAIAKTREDISSRFLKGKADAE